MPKFAVLFHHEVVRKDIPALPKTVKLRIRKAVEERLSEEPQKYGKPMRFTTKGLWRLRVGDWRVIYAIRPGEVWILKIGHRKDAYRDFESRSAG